MSKQIDTDDQGRTPLMLAVSTQGQETIKKLLSLEARQRGDIFLTDKNGRTALFYAAERGDKEIVWILLWSLSGTGIFCQRGILLAVKDNEGNLAEDWAHINGQEEISKTLSFERMRIEYFE